MASGLAYATRHFEFGEEEANSKGLPSSSPVDYGKKEKLMEYLQQQIIGEGVPFPGPFGERQMVYCDYTASGKSLQFIEDYIQQQVLPFYGNTHTTTSMSGRQSTFFRHEARELIKHAVHGTEDDVLLFAGNGATSAIHKLITSFGLDQLATGDLVVFVGPYEHHSNLLPWRELGARVITIPENEGGLIDMTVLEEQLQAHLHYRVKIGAFSAASNVSGVLTDQNAVTACLHRYEALAFWDFAAAGPYVPVDMNPVIEGIDRHLVYKDAIFLSPHKFLGGTSTPGILIAKRKLFQRPAPRECGGGTVFFVSREDHRYLSSVEEREEGGTPDIIGSIRCGLVFQLKQQIGEDFIQAREHQLVQQAKASLGACENIVVLGPTAVDRLPIFSFLVRHPQSGLYLHHNFVCAVLNDVYGIQVRGGCVCAGPYAQEILGIDYALSKRFESALLWLSAHDKQLEGILPRERDRQGAGAELLRPGFVRLNFHYSMSQSTFQFVLTALQEIAQHGWKLLPLYKYNMDTGEWLHRKWSLQQGRRWLGSINYFQADGGVGFHVPEQQHHPGKASKAASLKSGVLQSFDTKEEYYALCLQQSAALYDSQVARSTDSTDPSLLFEEKSRDLRWFLMPSEAREYLAGREVFTVNPVLFTVKTYKAIAPVVEEEGDEDEEQEDEESAPVPSQAKSGAEEFVELDGGDEVAAPSARKARRTGFRFQVPSKPILHSALSAIEEFEMIKDGDRVIACISGGKDSLSMLHLLRHHQHMQRAKGVHFDLAAATVDPMTHSTFDPSPLKVYMKALGIPYFYLEDEIMERAKNTEDCKSICSYCSRMKRGMLYTCARTEGYNVLALGQHLDDLAESFVMSLLHNGLLRTMKANYLNKEGDLRIIRPLCNTRERDLAKFAAEMKLPVIPENCPACFEAPKERHRIKQLLAAQEALHKNVFRSVRCAIKPLTAIDRTGCEAGTDGTYWVGKGGDEDASILDY